MSTLQKYDDIELIKSIKDFNLYPIRTLHESWYEHIGQGQLVAHLNENDRNAYILSQYLLKQYNLKDKFDFDFDQKIQRLGLLDAKSLDEVLLVLGAVLNYPALVSLISGKKIRAIKEAISVEYFHFSVKKAPLLLREPPKYTHGDHKSPPWENSQQLSTLAIAEYLKECGLRLIGAALGKYPKEIKWRLMWKLPYEKKTSIKLFFALANDKKRNEKANKIVLKILKERDLPCSQLFA